MTANHWMRVMSDIFESMGGHFCDLEQYAMLLRCSEKKDMTEWNEWREANPWVEIRLQGANLIVMQLQGANFSSAQCQGANFSMADCRGVNFSSAQCEGANFAGAGCGGANFALARCQGADFNGAYCQKAHFWLAHCQGTLFFKAYCQGANFEMAEFNSSTNFLLCTIDDTSRFSYSALAIIKIDPAKKALIGYIVRRDAWESWYVMHDVSLKNAFQAPGCHKVGNLLSCLWTWVGLCFVKFFWYVSDYGYSTGRVIKCFFIFILLFSALYTCFPDMLTLNNHEMKSTLPWRFFQMLIFAAATMVTLGFGNINASIGTEVTHLLGMIVVTCNLIVGYFMLAVLVTRLAILFQSPGPGEPRTKKKGY